MGAPARKLFLNLAVEDLDRSVAFFSGLGFTFDERFTDENATCMIVGEDAFVMLLVKPFFEGFAKAPLADPAKQTEALIAITADSRNAVDRLVETAVASGGSPTGDPLELDGMYERGFRDPDGHHWEVFWMDASALERQAVDAAA